jgi:ribosomal protein S19E (S16A)
MTQSKLSRLQQSILQMALAGHASGAQGRLADLYVGEAILALYVGGRVSYDKYAVKQPQRRYGGMTPAEYRSAQAALSRAFRRLEERGLVRRVSKNGGCGVVLTAEGQQVAKRLT